MRTLGVDAVRKWFAGGQGTFADSRVLPPILRRPVRILSRLDWQAPRFLGLKSVGVLFLATAISGMVIGGHTGTVAAHVTAASGLAIDQVKITGQSDTSEVDILDRLAIGQYPSLLTFDLDAARDRIETLPWVAQATLKKLYPDTLEVSVIERLPYALWQHGETVSLIDPQGIVISDYIDERYTTLPLVVGPGANARVDEFLDLILAHPDLVAQVRAGELIAERRWNIVLAGDVEIMLPEDNAADALARVAAINSAHQILARDIAAVDVRIPERLVVRLTERGLSQRQAMLEEQEKLARRKRTDT